MKWNALETLDQLATIDAESAKQPVMIFKHSTRCNISATSLARLERGWKNDFPVKPYYLDLISFRALSDEIAFRYGIHHESPQVLLIRDGKCVYNESHMAITVEDLLKSLSLQGK
jgi:bacillithiol system protein YtxJ